MWGGDLGIDQWYVWTLVSGMCGHLPVSCVSLYPEIPYIKNGNWASPFWGGLSFLLLSYQKEELVELNGVFTGGWKLKLAVG